MIRLRQVALVAQDLDVVLDDLNRHLGLEVAFNDPGVAVFGLRNAVLPVGTQFIEVVSPTQDGTAAGRQLERLGGDGGYMVISHTDDQGPFRERAAGLGVRTAFEADDHGYKIWQLHPGDTGGSFLEIDFQPGGDDPNGPWMPAGPDWQRAVRTEVVDGITAVEMVVPDPEMTAAHWSEILGQPHFDNAEIRWSEGTGGLVAVELARSADASGPATTHRICGIDFTF